jgi:hypothetical protein
MGQFSFRPRDSGIVTGRWIFMNSEDEIPRKMQALIDKGESRAEIARRFGGFPLNSAHPRCWMA